MAWMNIIYQQHYGNPILIHQILDKRSVEKLIDPSKGSGCRQIRKGASISSPYAPYD